MTFFARLYRGSNEPGSAKKPGITKERIRQFESRIHEKLRCFAAT